jgi:hypothetical protein
MQTTSENRPSPLLLPGVICTAAALTLLGAIIWAATRQPLRAGGAVLINEPWGIVTLIDVYAGALVVALWIWSHKRSVTAWLLWVVALICLGHLASLAYVLWRMRGRASLAQVWGSAPGGERISP